MPRRWLCSRPGCRRPRLISVRYAMTRAELLAARGETAAARDALTKVLALYESQNCCRATRSLALAERAMLGLGDLDSRGCRCRERA